jgi:hypothetical protein
VHGHAMLAMLAMLAVWRGAPGTLGWCCHAVLAMLAMLAVWRGGAGHSGLVLPCHAGHACCLEVGPGHSGLVLPYGSGPSLPGGLLSRGAGCEMVPLGPVPAGNHPGGSGSERSKSCAMPRFGGEGPTAAALAQAAFSLFKARCMQVGWSGVEWG